MAKQPKINVSVSVDPNYQGGLSTVAAALKSKGFVLKESLDAIGVLTGSVPADALADLSGVAGVSSVEQERSDYHTQT